MRIIVVTLSDSFEHVWDDLADGLGVEREPWSARDREIGADVAACLIAAGGAEGQALDWLESHEISGDIPRFVVGSDTNRRRATQLVARGSDDYFALPEDIEILRNALAAAVERRRVVARRVMERSDAGRDDVFREIVGESDRLREVLARATRVLPHTNATVLIVGETGTGKELLAQAIHQGGSRAGAPFVAVNCSALPDRLIESELFGHERGAFTDARVAKPGLFEVADGGTLFLDEIGDLPVELQAKLLRVLQDKEVRRVGGTKTRLVDVRVIAATNEDLTRAMAEGQFREDLFFRLSVIQLELPPLRTRGGDVMLIARALLEQLARQHGLPQPELTSDAVQALVSQQWPGNVRELRNALERALLLSAPGTLNQAELRATAAAVSGGGSPLPFPASLDDITTAAARATLDLAAGNRSEAARRLGISRRRLRRLLDGDKMTVPLETRG